MEKRYFTSGCTPDTFRCIVDLMLCNNYNMRIITAIRAAVSSNFKLLRYVIHMINKRLGTFLLFLIDIATVFITLQSSLFIRKNFLPYFHEFPDFPQIDFTFFWWIFYVWIFFFAYEGLYTKRFSFWDEIKMLWKVSLFSTLGVFTILYLGKFGDKFSRTVLVLMGIISFPVIPIIRTNAKKLLMRFGLLKSKVLVLGAGSTGKLIHNALRRDRNLGLEVVGFLDDDPDKIGGRINGGKIHAGVHKAKKYIGRCNIEDIVIAMPGCSKDKITTLVNTLQHEAHSIILIPDIFGITVLGTNLQHLSFYFGMYFMVCCLYYLQLVVC